MFVLMYWHNKETHLKPELKYVNLGSVGLGKKKLHKLLKNVPSGFEQGRGRSNTLCLLVFIW